MEVKGNDTPVADAGANDFIALAVSANMLIKFLRNRVFRHSSKHLINNLAVFEDQKGWNSSYTVLCNKSLSLAK
jgi:hypothetical protein